MLHSATDTPLYVRLEMHQPSSELAASFATLLASRTVYESVWPFSRWLSSEKIAPLSAVNVIAWLVPLW